MSLSSAIGLLNDLFVACYSASCECLSLKAGQNVVLYLAFLQLSGSSFCGMRVLLFFQVRLLKLVTYFAIEVFAWATKVFSWLICITVIFTQMPGPGFSVSGFNVTVDERKRGHHLCGRIFYHFLSSFLTSQEIAQ